jgi:ribosomal-protein-alanine N-acetyltransferase
MTNLGQWQQLYADPSVSRYIGGPQTKQTILKWLVADIAHFQRYGFAMGSLYLQKSGDFIGRAGLIYPRYDGSDNTSALELGYALHPPYWHQGYATEIGQQLVIYGFETTNVIKIIGHADIHNLASQRVMQQLGMHEVKQTAPENNHLKQYEILRI